MATQVMVQEHERAFSALEKYVLRRAHPRRAIFDLVGVMWAAYFLWQHDGIAALGIFAIAGMVGWISVADTNPEAMAETILGKIALLHLHPLNLFTQLVGLMLLAYALWQHSAEMILSGLTLLILGHVVGWSQVHPDL